MIAPFSSLIGPAELDVLVALAATTPAGGAFVECGVYQGGSAARLYALAVEQGRDLFLFDTFAGHPVAGFSPDHDLREQHWPGRFADAIAPDTLRAALPGAVVIPGTFPDTLPATMPTVAFVHCDMDLYLPTRAACLLFPPLMRRGGVILFDDYAHPDGCPGVVRAVDEVFGPGRCLPDGRRAVVIPPAPEDNGR